MTTRCSPGDDRLHQLYIPARQVSIRYVKGKFVRPEAEVLDRLRLAFFEELEVPVEEGPEEKLEQMRLM